MNHNAAFIKDVLKRQHQIRIYMQQNDIDACILTTAPNVFYVSGHVYNGYCYLPADGSPVHFLKRKLIHELDNVVYIRKPEMMSEELKALGYKLPRKILLETDVISFNECNRLLSIFDGPEIVNGSGLMRQIRSVKSEFEILQIKQCAEKHIAVYREIPCMYKKGMTDSELQFEIEYLMRQKGSLGIFRSYGSNMDIYMGSLLVGSNAESPSPYDFALGGKGSSPILPLGASECLIKEGNTIMVDMAGNYTPWMTDITRVFSVGKIDSKAVDAHKVSIEIHDYLRSTVKPGILVAEMYEEAIKIVRKNKLEDFFMGTQQQAKFIGHGVGLEINEPPVLTPRSKEILNENTVFALEPKFVIPGIGAVGIENTYLVRGNGLENLTVLDEEIVELYNV